MVKLSVCMIVKNEEDVIGRCLECVKKFADEIIIVDTGSTDKTKEIVSKYTKKIYDYIWNDNFADARNFSFSKATKEYLMWLDADDVIQKDEIEKIKALKKNIDKTVDIYMLKYNVGFDSEGKPNFTYYRERIVKGEKQYKWVGPIHEAIPPVGNIKFVDISIDHKKVHSTEKGRNLRIFKKMIDENIEFSARQQYYYARELYYNEQYDDAIENFNKFLDNKEATLENKINACLELSKCYKIKMDINNSIFSLFRSFEYDTPRPEVCCNIGNHFFDNRNYELAIFWYRFASTRSIKNETNAFFNMDYHKFIPYMQLCLCYYRIGNIEKAKLYNRKAEKIKPNDKSVIHNKNFFDKL